MVERAVLFLFAISGRLPGRSVPYSRNCKFIIYSSFGKELMGSNIRDVRRKITEDEREEFTHG